MKLSGWMVILAGIVALSSGLPSVIHIGGLFDAEDEELDIAFRVAVDWLNKDKTLLKNSKIKAKVERLYLEDTFKATQLTCDLLQKNVTIMFGPQSELPSMHIQSISNDLELPLIGSRWDHQSMGELSINLYPHQSVLSNAYVSLLEFWNWNEFFLVYEEDEAIIRMKDVLTEGEKKNWNIKLYQFKNHNSSSYRETFKNIKSPPKKKSGKSSPTSRQQIVLDVPMNHLYDVMQAAMQVGMMTGNQKYFITSLDFHTIDMKDFQHDKASITGLRLVQEDNFEFQEFLVDVNNRLAQRKNKGLLTTLKTETALMYDSLILLAHGLEQMDSAKNLSVFPAISCNEIDNEENGTSLIDFMKNVTIELPGLSGMIKLDDEGFRSSVSLDVMYSTPQGLKKIGTILPGSDVNVMPLSSSESEDFELEHSHFRVTSILNDPFTMLSISSELLKGNDRYEGYCVDLLNALAEKLHFTYEITLVKDKKYGMYDSLTGWNGMIGEVQRGEADFSIADLTITSHRLKAVDFTLPFIQTGIGILFKKSTANATSMFTFLWPFSTELWLWVIGAYTLISFILFLVGRMSPYEWSNLHPCRQNDKVEENCFSLLNSMWFTIIYLMKQKSNFAPTALSTRVIASMWYFFCLVMVTSYIANLAAFLTVEQVVSPIANAEDLANQEKIKYGCVASGSTRQFFMNSNTPIYQQIAKSMEKHAKEVYAKNNHEGVEKVKKGNYAFFMESNVIEYITGRHCDLTQIGGLLNSKGFGIAVRRGNRKLRRWLSGGILKLIEEGKLNDLKEKWWKHKKGAVCYDAPASSVSASELALRNVGGVFSILIMGLCLSACVAIGEFFWFQKKLQRGPGTSLCTSLMIQIRDSASCSNFKPAPKMKEKGKAKDEEKNLPGSSS